MLALVAVVAGGCGGNTAGLGGSPAVPEGAIAERFATSLVRGDAAGARDLLVDPNEEALVYLVRRSASRWRGRHVSVRSPARHSGQDWTVSFAGRRTYGDGRFESASGRLIMRLASSRIGPRIEYFLFADVRTRSSTHHDAQLLPSKR